VFAPLRRLGLLALRVRRLVPGLAAAAQVQAWGGVFNRYIPSEHSSYYDTSGSYYNLMTDSQHSVEEPQPRVLAKQVQELLQEEAAAESDPCHQRKCTANEHCCDGTVCVDTTNGVTGNCLPVFGKKDGESCYMDTDCETGYVCEASRCQVPAPGVGQFGDECRESSDCNIHKGLCCRLTRRQRMQPKKLCTYFTDADVCIGHVASNQVKRIMDHTAGEKRMSAHPDHGYLKYK